MPLTFSLRNKTSIPLEVDAIRLETVREQSADVVAHTLVQYGNKQREIGEFFDLSGSASDNELVWEGDCSHVKLIGSKLTDGRIRVEGNAGMHLGAEMSGGEIIVSGHAADWVGAEMHGGRIRVKGNAGHLIGAVYRGGRKGMTGGEILISGNAGNEIGHCMRRGLIAIAGNAGDAIGVNLLAGSIFVLGDSGIRPGVGMRRGTIGLLGTAPPPDMLPTFKYSGTFQPTALRLCLQHLRRTGFPVADELLDLTVHRHCGDFLELGRGEIWLRA
jgi:formylmethanofuran dehydrogenase subunit C